MRFGAGALEILLFFEEPNGYRIRTACRYYSKQWRSAAIQETMHLLSVPGMRESIRKAMAEPLSKSARELKW